jgi:hypothetical protein
LQSRWCFGRGFATDYRYPRYLRESAFARRYSLSITLREQYVLCDVTLFCQIYYYRWKNGHPIENSETESLLPEEQRDKSDKRLSAKTLTMRYTGALIFVCLVGTTAWWISGDGTHKGTVGHKLSKRDFWTSQILGWLSCTSFVSWVNFLLRRSELMLGLVSQIGARVPQISKYYCPWYGQSVLMITSQKFQDEV